VLTVKHAKKQQAL
jgi:hypothetical protein